MANEKRLIDANALEADCNIFNAWDAQIVKAWLEDQPTVDAVEVVHGRWIVRGGKRYCSHCKQRACVTRDADDFWYTVGTDYCPNCGTKMDGGNEDG